MTWHKTLPSKTNPQTDRACRVIALLVSVVWNEFQLGGDRGGCDHNLRCRDLCHSGEGPIEFELGTIRDANRIPSLESDQTE